MSIDLNNLKEQLQGIFQTANTTTASRDLSSGLTTRVQRVLKINPARIPPQASWINCVTIWIDSKALEEKTIAQNQMAAKRAAKVQVKIAGLVWNTAMNDNEVDDASEDCEDLMENIEEILRSNPTVAGVATWSFPTDVTYFNEQVGEETHLRAGVLTLQTTVYY